MEEVPNAHTKVPVEEADKDRHLITVRVGESIPEVLRELRSWEWSLYKYMNILQTLWNIFQTRTPRPNTFPSQQIVPIITPSS